MTDTNKEREALGPSGQIKEPYTLAEIKAKIASNDYSAELMLQHAMLHLDRLAASAGSEPVTTGSIDHLKLMMEASAWDGQLQLSDALANIDDFSAAHPSPPEGAGWMPVSEAPQGQLMLFCDMNASELRASFFVDWVVDGMFCGNRHHKATHCRPLPPAPPASEAKGASQ